VSQRDVPIDPVKTVGPNNRAVSENGLKKNVINFQAGCGLFLTFLQNKLSEECRILYK